eukprot:TRINITY_DN4461_c0_g1_i1.p1 TRINITY_DN4461_c0_g1~~TRINITY_DN4461_c0_g1_i1.p1  ORF type:complete len:790 (+),score=205.06 TRINITY_DN4461_c0_g1_i1:122-2491(+)
MEGVLNAIVDSITNILLVLEDATSSTQRKLAVNTTAQLGKAVDFLIDLAQKSADTYNDEYKRKMEDVIASMKKSASTLYSFSEKVVESSYNDVISTEMKKMLVDSVQMLKVQDEARVKNIVLSGKSAIDVIQRIRHANSVQDLVSMATDLTVLTNLATLINKRTPQVTNPTLSESLKRSVEVIKENTPQILIVSRAALEDKNNKDKEKARMDVLGDLVASISQAMSAVAQSASLLQTFDVEYFYPGGGGYRRPIDPALLARMAALRNKILSKLGDLKVPRGNPQDSVAILREITASIQDQIREGRALAEKIDDPEKKRALLEACAELEKHAGNLLKAAKAYLSDPTNEQFRAEYMRMTEKVHAITSQIQLAAMNAAIDGDVQRVMDALNIGDEAAAKEAAEKLTDHLAEYCNVARSVANQMANPTQKQKLLEKIAALEGIAPKLAPLVVQVVRNPGDASLKHELEGLFRDLQNAKGAIGYLTLRPLDKAEFVSDNDLPERCTAEVREAVRYGMSLNDDLDALLLAARLGDKAGIEKSARETERDIAALIQRARKVAAGCSDPVLKKELLDLCDELERTCNDIGRTADELAQNPQSQQLREKLEALIAKARAAASKVTSLVVKHAHAENSRAVKALKPIDARVPADMAEALQNVLMAANATQLPENSPQGRLVSISRTIAAELEKLSIAEDKRSMIQASRLIADSIQDVLKLASEIAAKCTNAKLKESLLRAAGVPKNFSTQLKILAAVKASTNDNKSANIQLFDCAKRLAMSVTTVIEAAESASLATAS